MLSIQTHLVFVLHMYAKLHRIFRRWGAGICKGRSQPGETHTNVNNFGRIDARAHNCVNGSDFVNLMAGHIRTGLGSQTDILTIRAKCGQCLDSWREHRTKLDIDTIKKSE